MLGLGLGNPFPVSALHGGGTGDLLDAVVAALPTAPALPSVADLGPTLLEPHASWMTRLTGEWARRYTR